MDQIVVIWGTFFSLLDHYAEKYNRQEEKSYKIVFDES